MTSEKIGFGVEIETHIADASPIYRAPWHSGRGHQPSSVLPVAPTCEGRHATDRSWRCERDRSVANTCPSGRKDCEWISPVLYGDEGIKHLHESVKRIKEVHGGKVNAGCGVHIHVDFPGDLKALSRLVYLVGCCEVGLYAATGTKRRERGSYCKPMKAKWNYGRSPIEKTPDESMRDARSDRFHLINLTHFGSRGSRVEFRVFSGSLNADKIVTWVRLVVGIVETVLNGKRRHSWKLKSYRMGRERIGYATLYELLVRIGWIKLGSQTKPPTGLIGMNVGPDLRESVRILKRLARKYDGET